MTMKSREHVVYETSKRLLDIIFAIVMLCITAPILTAAAVLIKLDGGPLLVTQERMGWKGKPFGLLKLRTTVPGADTMETHPLRQQPTTHSCGVAWCRDPRLTRIGSILRLMNLDELPQLVNVIKGEMSLVGPRQVCYEDSFQYGDYRDSLLSVRPGLTGYWQVKRRMSMSYEERVGLDCHYVRYRSLLLDLWILLATPISVLTTDYCSSATVFPPGDLAGNHQDCKTTDARTNMDLLPASRAGINARLHE